MKVAPCGAKASAFHEFPNLCHKKPIRKQLRHQSVILSVARQQSGRVADLLLSAIHGPVRRAMARVDTADDSAQAVVTQP